MPTSSVKLSKHKIMEGLLNVESRKEVPDLIILVNFHKIFNENLQISAEIISCLSEYSIKNNCCIIAGINDSINLKNEMVIQSNVIKNDCMFDITFKNKKYNIKMDVNKNKFLK